MFPDLPLDASLQVLLNQQWRNAALDFVLPLFSMRALLFAILCALLVWRSALRGKGQVAYFIVLVLAMGASDLSCNAVKHAVPRLRPLHSVAGTYYEESGQWVRLAPENIEPREKDTSFPSAHAANTAALALVAALFWPRLRRGVWALPLIVGWSRVYLGKHYPLDVAAGWLLGLCIGAVAWLLWRPVAARLRLAVLPDDLYRPFLVPPPDCR